MKLILAHFQQWRSQPKIFGEAKKFWGDLRCLNVANNTILFRKTPLKHKMTIFSKNWGLHGPFAHPSVYAYDLQRYRLDTGKVRSASRNYLMCTSFAF